MFKKLMYLVVILPAIASAGVAIPDAIRPPAGQVAKLTVHAKGDQIYQCTLNGGVYSWQTQAPDAKLFDGRIQVTGREFFNADLKDKWFDLVTACGYLRPLNCLPVPISFPEQRVLQFLPLLQVCLGNPAGQVTHLSEESLAFGHTDGAARVEGIKGVRTLQYLLCSNSS